MKKMILGSIVLLLLILVYYSFNPSNMAIFPKCPFLLLTGLKCPGCGSQRAIHCLLHFDIIGAIKYNFLLVAFLPVIVVLIYAEMIKGKNPALYVKLHKAKYIWTIFMTTISWWIIRNVFNI